MTPPTTWLHCRLTTQTVTPILRSSLPSPCPPLPALNHPSSADPSSLMSKVKYVSIWLHWAVDCLCLSRAPPPPLLVLPTHFLLPLLRPYLPLPLQHIENHFTPFFLLSHPAPGSERLSAAVVRLDLVGTTQLYLEGPGDLTLLAYSVVLFPFLWLVLSHSLFTMLARRWGIKRARKAARFGEQGYAAMYFLVVGIWWVYTLSTTPAPLRRTSGLTGVAPGSFLQALVPFPTARARPCVDSGLASARNADARSVPATSRSPAKLSEPNAGAHNNSASPGAILGHAELGAPMWMRGIGMRALYDSWECTCAAARGSVSVSVLVPVFALAS
ncbi:hypothetical protein B0H13DRAFT_2447095, partial [Mycena leptocephala]